jgi:hypothetical protein
VIRSTLAQKVKIRTQSYAVFNVAQNTQLTFEGLEFIPSPGGLCFVNNGTLNLRNIATSKSSSVPLLYSNNAGGQVNVEGLVYLK